MLNPLLGMSFISAILLLCNAAPANAQATFPLNDTGQTKCYDGSNLVACTADNAGDSATYPRQDGRFGRDAQAALNQLTKTDIGGGDAGFDFTTLDASGNTTTPGSHKCVKDNVTGLIWFTETLGGMTWDTAMAAGNLYSRCGFSSGWRLPTVEELVSIVDAGKPSPAIDTSYFYVLGTNPIMYYWTSGEHAPDTGKAWYVNFYDGSVHSDYKSNGFYVRLVRGGQ